jgi:nucleotide-binding universal stress UspA family protein
MEAAGRYLDELVHMLSTEVHAKVLVGSPEESIVRAVDELGVTDIVMTSHGRTAVSQVIMGSVVERLIHDLRCPIVVVPVLAALAGTPL